MVSGNKAGLLNFALAGLTGGASAFAIFAMPQKLLAGSIESIGLSGLFASPVDDSARTGIMAAAAGLATLLTWLALRSCDPPRNKTGAVSDDDLVEDWLSQRFTGRGTSVQPSSAEPVLELDDPFVALARSAEPIDAPLELSAEQIAEQPAAPANDDDACLSTTELLARMQPPPPDAGVADLIQHLNAGLVDSEWPLPAGGGVESLDGAEDRLRSVLRDLQAKSRGPDFSPNGHEFFTCLGIFLLL